MVMFGRDGMREFRRARDEILHGGLVEHSASSLALLRRAYGANDKAGQAEIDLIERKVAAAQPGRPRLHAEILASVLAVVRMGKSGTLLDIGCGEGLLLRAAAREPGMQKVVGIEAEEKSLRAAKALIEAAGQTAKIDLRMHDITACGQTELMDFDTIVLAEVVEHIADKNWIAHVFRLRPGMVIATTPNREFNPLYPRGQLQPNGLRHPGHHFEFTRKEFGEWAAQIAREHQYNVDVLAIGPPDGVRGSAGQMAVFQRTAAH